MFKINAHTTLLTWQAGKPALVFGLLSLVLLAGVAAVSEALYHRFALPVLVFTVISALGLLGLSSGYPHRVLGACNWVTLGRASLVCVLTGAIFVPVSAWTVAIIAIVAFACDGVDGWLARRSNLTSEFGARFDMETDALLGAVLTLVLLANGRVGAEVLVLGFSRYVYVAAGIFWPLLQGPLPYSFRRKAICVVQIAALIILVFPLTPAPLLLPVALVGAGALLYSFAVDIMYLVRHRA